MTFFEEYLSDLQKEPTHTRIDFCDFTAAEHGSFMFRVRLWPHEERGEHELCQIWPDDPGFPMLLLSVDRRISRRKIQTHRFAVFILRGKLVVTNADPGGMMMAMWEDYFYEHAFCGALERHMKKKTRSRG